MTSWTEIKKYQEENLSLKKQIEERTGKRVEQLYAERAKRVRDAIELREPNQVESFVKDLIDRCGKKGGLIIAIRMPDKAQTKDVQAMMKSLQEYGRY